MLRLRLASLLVLAALSSACLDPNALAFPAPANPSTYHCTTSTGSACQPPRARYWFPQWIVTAMAARGDKVAFTAYPPPLPEGPQFPSPRYLGQIDLTTGLLDWSIKMGSTYDDYNTTYDLTIAPNGDVIVVGRGYSELVLGENSREWDGFVAAFDSRGRKRFARQLVYYPDKLPPGVSTTLVNAKIVADDILRVQTAFYYTDNGFTTAPVHLFSFSPDGTQLGLLEVPISPGSYSGHAWPVVDGSIWIRTFPGPFRRYSKDGVVLDTISLQPDADVRGFGPAGPTTALINLTHKGVTNEMYRYDTGLPLTALFAEATIAEFHAGAIIPTLSLATNYFHEMKYDGLTQRLSRIDAKGNRGPTTILHQVSHRVTLFDNGEGVFCGVYDTGTEFIVQSLQ
ncbi:MAG TPA: hypothetical protein PKA58_15475 [Polyangium sp.]|nr:hypothetical protein [Polyangium sp.]